MAKRVAGLSPELEKQWLATVKQGDVAAMREMVRAGVAVDAPLASEGGKTVLAVMSNERGDAARDMVVALLEAGANAKKGKIDLVWATYFRMEKAVPLLIAQGADVDQKGGMGPPLRRAAAYDLRESAKLLIAAGADLNAGSLIAAVENNHTEMVKLLLEAGAKPEPGQKLLPKAIEQGNQEIAAALAEAGADVNERSDGIGGDWTNPKVQAQFVYATPLILAAGLGQQTAAAALLAAGADVHLSDKAGETALDWARKKGHAGIVALLEKAVGKQQREVDPSADLLLAAEKGETARVRELLAAGAKLEARDVRPGLKGRTPLMLAAAGGHVGTVAALLEAGADVVARDDNETSSTSGFSFVLSAMDVEGALAAGFQLHRTALHWAAERHAAVVDLLLRHGAEVNAVDRSKMTPLMIAADAGNEAVVSALLKAGADVKLRGPKKRDALMLAAHSGNAAIVRLLAGAGAEVNAKDAEGDTALVIAARKARAEVVEALLQAGADVHATNRDKETALAQVAGHSLRENKYIKGEGLTTVLKRPEAEMLRTAKLLMEAGADPLAIDKHNNTAMGHAERGLRDHPFYGQMMELFKKAPPREVKAKPAKVKKPAPAAAPRKTMAEPAPAPDFTAAAKTPAFGEALAELENLTGSKRQPLEEIAGGFSFGVHFEKAESFDLETVQARLLKRGCFLFYTRPEKGEPLGVLPTKEPLDALLAMQTNGINSDVLPQDIVAWLRETQQENPFVLTGVGHDFVEGRFVGKVKKPATLARRMAALCPDFDEEVAWLAADLKDQGKLFLWWD